MVDIDRGFVGLFLQARVETKNFLQSTISRYYSSAEQTDAVTLMWNHLMGEMRCCGVEDYRDFNLSEKWKEQADGRKVPEACCVLQKRNSVFIPQDDRCPYEPSATNSHFESVRIVLNLIYVRLANSCLTNFLFSIFSGLLRGTDKLAHRPSEHHCYCFNIGCTR